MRLIDADELRARMLDYYNYSWQLCEEINDFFTNAPTVDPVKHGRWVDRYDDCDWHCTRCGAIVEKHEQDYKNWYFCYHCGAKMDEVEE